MEYLFLCDIILAKIDDKLMYGLLVLRWYIDEILDGLKTYDARYYDAKNVDHNFN